jgi:hypothetical protein
MGAGPPASLFARYLDRRPTALMGLGIPTVAFLDELARSCPEWAAAVVEEGEEILSGRYRVFGQVHELGPTPDWTREPRTGSTWSGFGPGLDVIRLGDPGDVRVLWELNRGHHAVRLAQAFLLTKRPAFAERALLLVRHWIRSNPPWMGPNWHCAMEAALRAVNWIWVYHLLHGTGVLTADVLETLLPALWDHGEFIAANLEGRAGLVNSNHYLSDGIGLLYLGLFFSPSSRGRTWAARGRRILVDEMPAQVLEGGVDHEMSLSYHRLVTEIYLHAWLLARAAGQPLADDATRRLEEMIGFAGHYLRPDGRPPAWGDQDDGRLVPFCTTDPNDHGSLLQAGRILRGLTTPDPSAAGRFEAAWLTGQVGSSAPAITPKSRAYPAPGVFVLREGGDYLFFDAGPYGLHGHADALSFEMFGNGSPLLVDSGTFAYTVSLASRNSFRSTAAHNTVTVEGEDSSRLEDNCLWGARAGARVTLRRWASDARQDVVEAEHDGFTRLRERVVHRRRIVFEKSRRAFVVHDWLLGIGSAQVTVHFHVAPRLTVDREMDEAFALSGPDGRRLVVLYARAPGLTAALEPAEVSTRYGSKEPAQVLRFAGRVPLPYAASFVLWLQEDRPDGRDVEALFTSDAGYTAESPMMSSSHP